MASVNSYFPIEMDDERIRILMTAMPSKKDLAAFNGRLNFWSSALNNWMNSAKKLTFVLSDAQQVFCKGTVVPLCLPDVIQEMVRKGEVTYFEDYSKADDQSSSWAGWSQRVLKSSARWTWSKLQDTVGSRSISSSLLVNVKVLQQVSEDLLAYWWREVSPAEKLPLYTIESLIPKLGKNGLSLEDLNLLLHYLAKQQRISLCVQHDITYVKFLKPGSLEVSPISETEIAEFKLMETESALKQRLESLNGKLTKLRAKAKLLVTQDRKKEALLLLKKKKKLEKFLETTSATLESVESLLEQLEQTRLNMKIIDSFKLGLGALRSSVSEETADDASETLEAIQEVLDECGDLGETLSFGLTPQTDEESLEEELENLLTSLTIEDDFKEEPDLPSVPTTNPLVREEVATLMKQAESSP